VRVALTVAGSDSGGGAGVLADAATFSSLGVWATIAITAVTAQNTVGVARQDVLDPGLVRAQIEAVATDIGVDAMKTGMLGGAATVEAVVAAIIELHLPAPVVDPVLVSSSGQALLDADGLAALQTQLLPLASVVTPNLAEASVLTGLEVVDRPGMVRAATSLIELGAPAALITGGHLESDDVADCLVIGDQEPAWFTARRVQTSRTHGTGCVLSAALAALLARGEALEDACAQAGDFVRRALVNGVDVGHGPGPVGRVSWRPGDRP
jgi:hydroxymethylpyrimidine kinase/phosphomethylpyrimidine kinase